MLASNSPAAIVSSDLDSVQHLALSYESCHMKIRVELGFYYLVTCYLVPFPSKRNAVYL